jgi:hypothetical protein
MVKHIGRIAEGLGAKVMHQVPEMGGGAFGAARLAKAIDTLRTRLVPGEGRRPGRPSDASWVRHPKVPMSEATERRLAALAARASTDRRKVSPMQIAAQLLEDALAGVPEQ